MRTRNKEKIKLLYEHYGYSIDVFASAAVYCGYPDMLEWLVSEGFVLNGRICKGAIRYGKLAILDWVYEQGMPLTEKLCAYAMARRDTPSVAWFIVHGVDIKISTFTLAHKYGSREIIDIIDWVRIDNISVTEEVLEWMDKVHPVDDLSC